MPSLPRRVQSIFAFAAILFLSTACGGDEANLLGPGNQVQINNAADNFQWQASNMDNITETLTYPWQNTGTSANIDQSSSLTGGSATLRITDAAGTQVYSRSLASNGTFQTSAGVTGEWTIRVEISGGSGMLNFRAQKP